MKCQSLCDKKATLAVVAWGENGWKSVHCDKHAGRVIRLRARLIRRSKLNVTVRPVSKIDKPGRTTKKGKK